MGARWSFSVCSCLAVIVGCFLSGIISSGGVASDISVEATPLLDVRNAWARATPGSVRQGVVFLEIANTGTQDDTLVSASVDGITSHVEIHETLKEGAVMKMRHIGRVSLPAQSVTRFQPGGLHMMLKSLTGPLREGDTPTLTLTFEKAKTRRIPFVVGAIGAVAYPAPDAHAAP